MTIYFNLLNNDTSKLRWQKKAVVDALVNLGGRATMAEMDKEVFRLLTDECSKYMMNGLPFVQTGRRIIDWHSNELITRGYFEKETVRAPKAEKPLSPRKLAKLAKDEGLSPVEAKKAVERVNKDGFFDEDISNGSELVTSLLVQASESKKSKK